LPVGFLRLSARGKGVGSNGHRAGELPGNKRRKKKESEEESLIYLLEVLEDAA